MIYTDKFNRYFAIRFVVYVIAISIFSVFSSYIDAVVAQKFGLSSVAFAFWVVQGPAVWLIPTGGGFLRGSAQLDLTGYFIFFLILISILFSLKSSNKKLNTFLIFTKIAMWLLSAVMAMLFFEGA